jgi:NAD(P)-dependent dehydrogenase (short-subunit alcohol dehydrogenase family)
MGICKDRTVIITGAGAGLGRAYALALGAAGANVIVNDIRAEAAQAVVDEIAAAGGQALASSEDITRLATAQKIVDAAVARFGEVHAVVNNAGVLRDRMFISLSEEDWDEVMRVHLKGHFCLANVLAKRWRDQSKAGVKLDTRIINTSSGAGLAGSVGQSNYSWCRRPSSSATASPPMPWRPRRAPP